MPTFISKAETLIERLDPATITEQQYPLVTVLTAGVWALLAIAVTLDDILHEQLNQRPRRR